MSIILLTLQVTGTHSRVAGSFLCNLWKNNIYICETKYYKINYDSLKFDDRIELADIVTNMVIKDADASNTQNLLEQIFIKYKYVTSLCMHNADALEVSENSFENAFELSSLDLRLNNLKVLEGNLFKNTKKLDYVDVSYNRIEKIDSRVFQGIKSLTQIYLHCNNLALIEPGSFDNMNLEKLTLNDNKLVKFDFQTLNVQALSLHNNTINQIVKNSETNVNIIYLFVPYNNLTSLDPLTFKQFKRIQLLTANNNFIQHLSSTIFQGMTNLTEIDLSSNKIKSIEKGAFYNLKLLKLDLSDNLLLEFDFQYLTVYEFRITKNELSSLLINGNASYLHLDDNKIKRMEIETRSLVTMTVENNDKNMQIQYV